MRLANRLDEWQAAGLIDAASVAAILAHERERARPVALFAVAGLGLMALALGLFSLVAANWDDIPPALKLAVHLALTAGAAVAVMALPRRERPWAAEGALFLLAALTLAGIALHAQVYQRTGALWQALALWAVLTSPALLLLGRTRLTAYGYALMLAGLGIAYLTDAPGVLGRNLTLAIPPALVLASLAMGEARADFRAGLFDAGLAMALIAASVAQIGWVDRINGDDAWSVFTALPLAACLVVAAGMFALRRRPGLDAELIAVVLGGSLLAGLFAVGLPHGSGPAVRLVGVLVFLALWGGVAAAASRAGWHRLFSIAVGMIAIRLLLVYFELFYSLAFTSVGLMIAGLLLIALAWGWRRIVRSEAR